MKDNEKKIGFFGKLAIGVCALVFLFVFYLALDANKYEAVVRVVEGTARVGLNPTTERLDFGDLSPGTTAVRSVTIENGTGIPFFVFALRLGSITDIMEQSNNFFVMAPHAEETIEWSTYMPASAPIGEKLSGRVILFKIPGPWK
jgi:hypothetical protein